MTDELALASDFVPLEGEANFGPPITREVVGGTHIAPECVIVRDGVFLMTEWPQGLARHDKSHTVRFPHGLIRIGETFEDCTKRLVKEQMGISVTGTKVLYIYSYVDSANHWHIEPLMLVHVTGDAQLPPTASRLIEFTGSKLPNGAVWSQESFSDAYEKYISPHL